MEQDEIAPSQASRATVPGKVRAFYSKREEADISERERERKRKGEGDIDRDKGGDRERERDGVAGVERGTEREVVDKDGK